MATKTKVDLRKNLFSGVYPTGIIYADRSREENGDYKHIAHLSFATLELTVWAPKSDLLGLIREDAAKIQSRAGEPFEVSASGQTIILGFARR